MKKLILAGLVVSAILGYKAFTAVDTLAKNMEKRYVYTQDFGVE
jgi:hypothetical protein